MSEILFQEHEPIPPPEKPTLKEKIISHFAQHPRHKKVVFSLAILFLLISAIGYVQVFSQQTIYMGGIRLIQVVSTEEYQRYEATKLGYDYVVTVEKEGDQVDLRYELPGDNNLDFELTSDYQVESDFPDVSIIVGNNRLTYLPNSYDHYRFVHERTQYRGDESCSLLAALVFLIWYLNLRYPLLQFHLHVFGVVDDGTPSDLYYFTRSLSLWIFLPLLFFIVLFLSIA